jgi:tetratricopeptide (TPR) repeat protein
MNNDMSGAAHTVLQARQITGDVYVTHGAAPSIDVPRQLPPRRGQVIDREQERALLRSALLDRPDRSPVVVLTGLGGIGKTALAVDVGHLLAQEFPDGQLFADLVAFSEGGPARVTDVLVGFLTALGVPAEHVPAREADRMALYRTRTAGRRLLIVLDNAHDADQVRPLIPASDHASVLITSRSRLSELALDGAQYVQVEHLDREHAVDLITALLGTPTVAAERAAAEHLAEACDGHPLALSIACALISTRPGRSLSSLAHELASRAAVLYLSLGVHTIRGVLDVSYDDLSPTAIAVSEAMSWHPGAHFTAETAAAAVAQPIGEVRAALNELVEASLLVEQPDGRLVFHNLAREYAFDRVTQRAPELRTEVLARLAGYYRDRCVAADLALRPHQRKFAPAYLDVASPFAGRAQALAWFRAERDAAVALLRTTVERAWSEVGWTLAEPLWTLLHHDGHLEEALETQRLGELAATRCGHWFQAVALTRQGHLLRKLGQFDKAGQRCSRALSQVDHYRDNWPADVCEWLESVATNGQGHAAEGLGQFDQALTAFTHSLHIEQRRAEANPNSTGYAIALRRRDIAWVLAQQGQFDEAHQQLDLATAIMQELVDTYGDAGGYGRTLYLRGRIYALAGKHRSARAAYNAAEQILPAVDGHRWLVDLYVHAADTDVALRDITAADRHLRAAIDLAERGGRDDLARDLRARLAGVAENPGVDPGVISS